MRTRKYGKETPSLNNSVILVVERLLPLVKDLIVQSRSLFTSDIARLQDFFSVSLADITAILKQLVTRLARHNSRGCIFLTQATLRVFFPSYSGYQNGMGVWKSCNFAATSRKPKCRPLIKKKLYPPITGSILNDLE